MNSFFECDLKSVGGKSPPLAPRRRARYTLRYEANSAVVVERETTESFEIVSRSISIQQ